jgi:hypothetical protein
MTWPQLASVAAPGGGSMFPTPGDNFSRLCSPVRLLPDRDGKATLGVSYGYSALPRTWPRMRQRLNPRQGTLTSSINFRGHPNRHRRARRWPIFAIMVTGVVWPLVLSVLVGTIGLMAAKMIKVRMLFYRLKKQGLVRISPLHTVEIKTLIIATADATMDLQRRQPPGPPSPSRKVPKRLHAIRRLYDTGARL